MPSGRRLKISEEQVDVIRGHAQQGLKARRILRLNLKVLEGFGESTIQRIICREGLVDPVRSRRFRKAHRLTVEEKERLLSYLSGSGRNLPDLQVARNLGLTKQNVYWHRFKRIGAVQGPRRISPEIEQERRLKIRRYYAEQRARLYENLCALQSRLESQGFDAPLKTCSVCGDRRFATTDFFYLVNRSYGEGNFSAACRVCATEMNVLKRLRRKPEEIMRIMSCLIWQKPVESESSLSDQFRQDTSQRCTDPLVRCMACRKFWYRNGHYFHVDGGLQSICLACPMKKGKRKFLFIDSGQSTKTKRP